MSPIKELSSPGTEPPSKLAAEPTHLSEIAPTLDELIIKIKATIKTGATDWFQWGRGPKITRNSDGALLEADPQQRPASEVVAKYFLTIGEVRNFKELRDLADSDIILILNNYFFSWKWKQFLKEHLHDTRGAKASNVLKVLHLNDQTLSPDVMKKKINDKLGTQLELPSEEVLVMYGRFSDMDGSYRGTGIPFIILTFESNPESKALVQHIIKALQKMPLPIFRRIFDEVLKGEKPDESQMNRPAYVALDDDHAKILDVWINRDEYSINA